MSPDPRIFRNFCNFCGGILISPRSIKRGYGPVCWKKVRPQPIKPYVDQVPFVDTGTTDYMAKIYGEFNSWEDSF